MRILIVSLFYEPLNNIAATRLETFCKYLKEYGHEVDVLTRHYSEEDLKGSNLSVAMNAGDDISELYYKKDNVYYTRYSTQNSRRKISNILPPGIRGLYNLHQMDIYHYSFVENGLEVYKKEFAQNKHDLIIASTPPPAALLLARALNNKYQIPWIADFRDSHIATEDKPSIQKLKAKTQNRVLNSASGILFVSKGMETQNKNVFSDKVNQIPTEIIYNGFEQKDTPIDNDVIERVLDIKKSHKKTLVYTGSLYPERKLDFFLKGLEFVNDREIAIVIVGIQNDFKTEIEKTFTNVKMYFIDKVSYSTAIKIQEIADYLLLTIWKDNYTGFSGKVFEYLYSENNIILDYKAPTDLKEYLQDFANIHYADESFEKFKEIITQKVTKEKNNFDVQKRLGRRYQVEKLNKFITSQIK